LDMGVLASQNGGGKLSYINRYRYYSGYTGETTAIVGYTNYTTVFKKERAKIAPRAS